MTEQWTGRRVVVTGAAGGIGTALCRAYAEVGADVVAVDRDREGLAHLQTRVPVRPVHLDITMGEEVAAVLGDIGDVDILVNNAGVTALGAFSAIPVEGLRRVLEVNVIGAANVTRALLDGLIRRRGRIGVLSSVAGFSPLVHRTHYSASKHALHGLFESLRAELAGTGATVTMICPSFADTGIEDRAVARAADVTGEWSTTGRHLTADEVARAVVHGLDRRRRVVFPGATAKLAYALWRVAPAAYESVMRRRVAG